MGGYGIQGLFCSILVLCNWGSVLSVVVLTSGEQNGVTYNKLTAYGQSKTANMLFSVSLAEKLQQRGLLSYSCYPGRVKTNIVQSIPMDELQALGEIHYFSSQP